MSMSPVSIFDAIFGQSGPTQDQADAAAQDAYRRGLEAGFAKARDHMEKVLLRQGQTALADSVKKLRLRPKRRWNMAQRMAQRN